MYNLNKASSENCLLIVTVSFVPTSINSNGNLQLVQLDGKDGTANGAIEVQALTIPGSYEVIVIGYVVHNPFIKQQGSGNIVKTSYRFTLVVE